MDSSGFLLNNNTVNNILSNGENLVERDLSQIIEDYKQKFDQWLKTTQTIAISLWNQQEMIRSGSTEIVPDAQIKEGSELLESFRRDFGINITYILGTKLRTSYAQAYVLLDIPYANNEALSDALIAKASAKDFDGRTLSPTSEGFKMNLNINSLNGTIGKLYTDSVNNDVKEFLPWLSPQASIALFTQKELRVRKSNGTFNEGFGLEAAIAARLIKDHIKRLYGHFDIYLRSLSQHRINTLNYNRMTNHNADPQYGTLAFGHHAAITKKIRRMIIPDNAAGVFEGDFEYADLHNALFGNRKEGSLFLYTLMHSSRKMVDSLESIKRDITIYNPLRFQIKGEGGRESFKTVYNYIAMLNGLLQNSAIEQALKTMTKQQLIQIFKKLAKNSYVQARTFGKHLLDELYKELPAGFEKDAIKTIILDEKERNIRQKDLWNNLSVTFFSGK